MIHSSNVRKVIDNFKRVIHLTKGDCPLNMKETNVNSDHPCGTPHCHAGWYAIATDLKIPRIRFAGDFTFGANEMANDLGLSSYIGLIGWVIANKSIWGHTLNYNLFGSKGAFYHPTKRPNGAESLQHIIDHWEEVYLRLYILENPIEITEPPVSIEDILEEEHAYQIH